MGGIKQTPGIKQLHSLYKLVTSGRYTIGIAIFDDRVVESGFIPKVHWIKDDHKRGWFADPFILRMTDKEIVFLVEEWIYKYNRGVISQVIISRDDYSIKDVKIIINTGKHMSFPIYYRKNGKVYLYPEQSARGETWLYEYDEDTCTAKEVELLNPNDVVDTTISEIKKGEVVLLSTTAPNHNGDILDVYPYYETGCTSTLRPIKQIKFTRKTARNAGVLFRVNGKLYRPAQDCTIRYGECVEIQEVRLDENEITFIPRNCIFSPNKEYNLGFHTFNVFNDEYVAVDAYKRRFLIGGLVKGIGSFIGKFFKG